MINYQTMLSFNTEHQYFDFNALPVQVLPTAETNKILNHCGFLFQKLETGCRILKQAGNANKQIMDARAIRTDVSEIMLMVDPDSVLEFWISTDDPEFHLYTDCSPEEKEEASISLQVDSDDKTNENCYRYNRHLQADDKTQNSGGNHSGKTSITPVFHYQQKSEFNPKFKADIWESGFDTKYKPLFVFRIPLRELVHRKSAINITARFLSRRVLWRYNIIADD